MYTKDELKPVIEELRQWYRDAYMGERMTTADYRQDLELFRAAFIQLRGRLSSIRSADACFLARYLTLTIREMERMALAMDSEGPSGELFDGLLRFAHEDVAYLYVLYKELNRNAL